MTDKRNKERILQALRGYVNLGLPVIPLCSHDHVGYSTKHQATCRQAGKIPLIKGWREHQTTTLAQVQAWISEFRNINIGLPLGQASGYVGIDIDGEAGEDMLIALSDDDLPATWEYTTGAGRRLLYAIPVGMATKKYVNPGEGEHEECSIICDGQQTVLPPSVHHSGRIYEWTEGHSPDDMDCEMAPSWLLDLIRLEQRPGHRGPGTMDLTRPGGRPDPEADITKATIEPLLLSESVLPSEFIEFDSIELDLIPPDVDYLGKGTKEQQAEDNKVTESELMQTISSGSRDNQMTRIIGSFCAQFRGLGRDYIMVMAKNHNLMFCDPPLDEYAIEAKVNHFWETEQMKTSQFRNPGGGDGDKKRFSPDEIAQVVINVMESEGHCLKVDAEQPIIWITRKSEGPWSPLDTRSGTFQGYIREPLRNPELGGDPTWTTIRHYKDVANAVVVHLRVSGRVWQTAGNNMDTQTVDGFEYIPLSGGKLLNWRTRELLPWDPETNLTYVLPVDYDPAATAPNWVQKLKEWLPDEGSRSILQEFIGYSLIPYMGFEKALVIQGEGANGKSLFLETIHGLLGYEVVDSVNMRTLFSRFGQNSLIGKILNIVNEAGSEYLRGSYADDFKNLVSGGRVTADVKNLAPITFNNTAKFIFASNHDIKTGDKSDGWLRRMLIIPFEQNFQNSKVPKFEIMETLRREYAGIFNWAVEGLQRLMLQRDFSYSESAKKKKQAYMQENDVSADFFVNCMEVFDLQATGADGKPVPKAGLPSAVVNNLFSAWVDYRESTIQKKVDYITKYLEKKHHLVKQRTTHTLVVKKTMTECWIGLKLNIRDTAFLEHLLEQPIPKYPELKEYCIKKLRELDDVIEDAEYNYSTGSQPMLATPIMFPDTQAL